ncbi:unnamed protein product [Paramecium sonneborni]|uniref:USP domain-containing protein n=1 Tax=Paramecium sonneborni TaxID=65129 RepID=A0A8S1RPK4_9CILI|nr:unnamed protein product [Paramecium sonneborni]
MELNQKDKKLQEIQNIVNRIKAYREEGKLNLTIDIEKSFVTYLIEEDLPTIYFVEYKWAVNHKTFFRKFKIKIELDQSVIFPDIINDGQTNFISHTTNTSKISIEPLIDIAKLEFNNMDDSEKSPNTNTTRRTNQQKTNSIKIQPKFYELPYVGLQNPKYYCYMNSALQCLLSIRELNDSLLKQPKQQNKKFTMAYQGLLRLVQNSIPGSAISVEKLQNKCLYKFKYQQQQDAHEFLLYLLSEIQQELVGKNEYKKEEFLNA